MVFRNHPCNPVGNSGICKIAATVFAAVWRSCEQQLSLVLQLFGEVEEKTAGGTLFAPTLVLERDVTFFLSKLSCLCGELLSSRIPAN